MAGIVFLLRRDGAPLPRPLAEGLLARLDHRGPDGRRLLLLGHAALGHQHFRTTPEEVGESQPLSSPGGVHLALDGRFDNRGELLEELDAGPGTSDAALALAAYERWGQRCLERFLGPFALVIFDAPRRRVLCGRDALGARSLFYTLTPRLFVAASEETALLAHPEVSERLDDTTLARFFAVAAPAPGRTFFAAVSELPPAHGLLLAGERFSTWRHWEPRPDRRPGASDEEHAEGFRQRLAAAVACRLRTPGRPALLMSGGLDSTSLAALAVRRPTPPERRLTAVSWVFDRLDRCDERRFIHPVVRRLGLPAVEVPGDDGGPLSGRAPWPVSPSSPTANPYRGLLDAAYGAARERGCRVVLNGWSGDHLWAGADGWLADLLREGRWLDAARETVWHLAAGAGARRRLATAAARALGRRCRPAPPPPWLTPFAAERLAGGRMVPHPRHAALAGIHLWNAAAELPHAHRAGVELRLPYRDRRLVEHTLALPAHQLYHRGRVKHVLRRALADLLPPEVLERRGGTMLTPLFERGLFGPARERVEALLSPADALWRRSVRQEWLDGVLDRGRRGSVAGIEAAVLWQCVSAELWRRERLERAPFGRDVTGWLLRTCEVG